MVGIGDDIIDCCVGIMGRDGCGVGKREFHLYYNNIREVIEFIEADTKT